MNDFQLLSLGEVRLWGNHHHGLALMFGATTGLMIDAAKWPLNEAIAAALFDASAGIPRDDEGSTHLIKVPGIGELDMTPEEIAAERAAGRAWQNYALLSGSPLALLGQQMGGWICIDPDGQRWWIKPKAGTLSPRYGTVSSAGPLTFTFEVRPYGYFEQGAEEAAPVEVGVTLNNLGQANPSGLSPPNGSILSMRMASISSHGRSVIISLLPTKTNPPDCRDLPYGYLLLELAGPGPEFEVTLTVLRSRAQCFGEFSTSVTGGLKLAGRIHMDLKGTVLIEERDGSGNLLHGEALYEPTTFTTLQPGDPGWQYGYSTTSLNFTTGNSSRNYYMHDRLVALTYDDQDQLVEVRLDWEEEDHLNYATPVVTASGGYTLVTGSAVAGSRTGSVHADIALHADGDFERRVRLKRGSEVISSFTLNTTTLSDYTLSVDLPLTDSFISAFTELAFSPVSGRALYMIGAGGPGDNIPDGDWWNLNCSATMDGKELYNKAFQRRFFETANSSFMPLLRLDAATDLEISSADSNRLAITAMRLSNHLCALRFEQYQPVSTSAQPTYAKSAKVVPTAGVPWENTKATGDTDPPDRIHMTGSYEPFTHAIHVDVDWTESNRERGFWI
ncbi:hypothetical protein P3W53_06975 [Pseudomonas denitrificans (nom. rej.)]|nr:hypothetical protein [Pseudomonas denitrificans (nom. rej.)]